MYEAALWIMYLMFRASKDWLLIIINHLKLDLELDHLKLIKFVIIAISNYAISSLKYLRLVIVRICTSKCALSNNLSLNVQIINGSFNLIWNIKNGLRSSPEKLHASRKQYTAISRHLPPYSLVFHRKRKSVNSRCRRHGDLFRAGVRKWTVI